MDDAHELVCIKGKLHSNIVIPVIHGVRRITMLYQPECMLSTWDSFSVSKVSTKEFMISIFYLIRK